MTLLRLVSVCLRKGNKFHSLKIVGTPSPLASFPLLQSPWARALLPVLWSLRVKWLVCPTLLFCFPPMYSSWFFLLKASPHMWWDFSPHPCPACFPQLCHFPCLFPCFWPSIITKTIQRREVFLWLKYGWKWWYGNEAMGKGCGNCPSCLFPAALVSSGPSLNVGWTSSSHMELPLEQGWNNNNTSASLSW